MRRRDAALGRFGDLVDFLLDQPPAVRAGGLTGDCLQCAKQPQQDGDIVFGVALRGRGTLAKEKPAILGLIQRGGEVALRMLETVQQKTIAPVIRTIVTKGTRFYTDEYDIDARLPTRGYDHHTVCHSRGEYARDEDGDGFHEIHVNTIEGVWSLLRSWLRPHRGISQEHLPLYLSFFQFVHNARVSGKGLLPALLGTLLA